MIDLKVNFKNIAQINKFCKAAEKYDGNVTVSCGSVEVDGESIIGLVNLGFNKTVDVQISDKFSASAMLFQAEVEKLGIVRD